MKDQSKLNSEKIFIEKITVKCRVYDKSEIMAVKSLGRFFAQNDYQSVFDEDEHGFSVKSAFNRLLK